MTNINDYKAAVAAAAAKSNRVLNRQLRRTARRSGWSRDVADGLSVDVMGDSQVSMTTDAEDAEFGTLSAAPNPVVRDFEANDISATFQKYLRKELRKRGVRI